MIKKNLYQKKKQINIRQRLIQMIHLKKKVKLVKNQIIKLIKLINFNKNIENYFWLKKFMIL